MKLSTRIPIVTAGALIFITLACNFLSGTPITAPTPLSPVAASPTSPAADLPTPTVAPAQPVLEVTSTDTTLPAPVPTETPTAGSSIGSNLAGEYAVILVKEGDILNVRQSAGANQPIVARLLPGAAGITLTGREKQVGDDRWVEIHHPDAGSGWVNAYYLTEYVPPAEFCADRRVNTLLDDLGQAITTSDGGLLSSLVSPAHGLNLQYFHNGNIANYSPQEARWVFISSYIMNWGIHPASGLEVKATFHDEVLPTLVEMFKSETILDCNASDLGGGNYTYSWPGQYSPINYYKITKPGTPGVDLDWRVYLAGVEYVGGKPFLFTLIHFFWEP